YMIWCLEFRRVLFRSSISVTATDSSSPALTATNSATVTISPLTLVVTITGPTTGTVGSAVTFTANPTGGTTLYTFAWTATGGSRSEERRVGKDSGQRV